MNTRKYNSLLFDLDDTLLDYSGAEIKAALSVLENHNLPHTSDVAELFSNINDWHTFELGKEITAFDVIVYRFTVLLKMLEVSSEHQKEMQSEFYSLMQNSHKLKAGALKTLRYLKNEGYKLYITTNGYPDFQYKRIKAAKIGGLLNGIFVSEEIGHKKPSRAFFDYVMNNIPENCRSGVLIIGDAPTADIFGGINSGIDTCWISDANRHCKYKYTYKITKIDELIKLL